MIGKDEKAYLIHGEVKERNHANDKYDQRKRQYDGHV